MYNDWPCVPHCTCVTSKKHGWIYSLKICKWQKWFFCEPVTWKRLLLSCPSRSQQRFCYLSIADYHYLILPTFTKLLHCSISISDPTISSDTRCANQTGTPYVLKEKRRKWNWTNAVHIHERCFWHSLRCLYQLRLSHVTNYFMCMCGVTEPGSNMKKIPFGIQRALDITTQARDTKFQQYNASFVRQLPLPTYTVVGWGTSTENVARQNSRSSRRMFGTSRLRAATFIRQLSFAFPDVRQCPKDRRTSDPCDRRHRMWLTEKKTRAHINVERRYAHEACELYANK